MPDPGFMLVGAALNRADGERIELSRLPSAVCDALLARRRDEAPDQWVILGSFEGDRRGGQRWRFASGLMVDLDYEDPAVPRDEGSHQAIPDELRGRIIEALADFPVAGFAYLTPRGLRWGCVFDKDVDDPETYAELVDLAAQQLLEHLAVHAVPLWREGVTGLRYDTASGKPEQAMRLPLSGAEVILTGGDYPIYPIDSWDDDVPRLSLDEVLPTDLAEGCRQIAHWVQIAVEVVVTGLLGLASAAIGNTRWIVVRGLKVPLSLHYVTVVASGSGKSTVRTYLRGAAKTIEQEIAEQRKKAEQERQEYEASLEAWRSACRRSGGRAKAGNRPEPPPLSARGGERVSFMITEATLEGVGATLEDTPRGLLWASDEADEVLGTLGRYGQGSQARNLDAARLRRYMDSQPSDVHRARGNSSPIRRLPRPWLAIDFDVQPRVFERLFSDEDHVSGMTARFLAHAPPSLQGKRKYVEPPPEPEQWVHDLLESRLEALWSIELTLEDGIPQYEPLHLDPAAEMLWAQELERLERLYSGATEEEVGTLGHARGRILRLAGNLALLRDPKTLLVVEEDMRRAIEFMRYHLAHDRRFRREAEQRRRGDRLEELRGKVQRIYDRQKEVGVRPTDLRHNINKTRYGAEEGRRRALADLHALGWALRRPKSPASRAGRRHVPAFFPCTPANRSDKSAKPPGPESSADLADKTPGPASSNGTPARDLLDRASAELLSAGVVDLPPVNVRGQCPACGSSDGLGVLPMDPTRWHCHSEGHAGPRGGCAVDYFLAGRLGRMPTPAEAVEEAKRVLGLDGSSHA